MNESRVGYATIDVLLDLTKDYIRAYTVNGKYTGRLDYLYKAQVMERYLNDGQTSDRL